MRSSPLKPFKSGFKQGIVDTGDGDSGGIQSSVSTTLVNLTARLALNLTERLIDVDSEVDIPTSTVNKVSK